MFDCAEGRMYDVLMEGYNNVWILDVDGVHLLIVFEKSDEGGDQADGGVDPLRTLTRHRSAVLPRIEHAGVTVNRFTVVADGSTGVTTPPESYAQRALLRRP